MRGKERGGKGDRNDLFYASDEIEYIHPSPGENFDARKVGDKIKLKLMPLFSGRTRLEFSIVDAFLRSCKSVFLFLFFTPKEFLYRDFYFIFFTFHAEIMKKGILLKLSFPRDSLKFFIKTLTH